MPSLRIFICHLQWCVINADIKLLRKTSLTTLRNTMNSVVGKTSSTQTTLKIYMINSLIVGHLTIQKMSACPAADSTSATATSTDISEILYSPVSLKYINKLQFLLNWATIIDTTWRPTERLLAQLHINLIKFLEMKIFWTKTEVKNENIL